MKSERTQQTSQLEASAPRRLAALVVTILITSVLSVGLSGCEYDSSLSATRCTTNADCTGASCVDGYCLDEPAGDADFQDVAPDADCPSDQILCDGKCVDPLFNDLNCGGCNIACADTACVQGECRAPCDDGLVSCDGTCSDLETDPAHCGACNSLCQPPTAGTAACVAGTCEIECGGDLVACGQECVDLASDVDHCGACDTVCPAPQNGSAACVEGTCEIACDGNFEVCEQQCCEIGACDPTSSPFGGGSGTSGDPYTICTAAHLQAIGDDTVHLDKHFVLSADLDLSAESFSSIGDGADPFAGSFVGDNHTISHLKLHNDGRDQVGMFGVIAPGATVGFVQLADATVTGQSVVGVLAGRNEGEITDVEVSGNVTGGGEVGGLVGRNEGRITDSSASGTVESQGDGVGGLVGHNTSVNGVCKIVRSHAAVDVVADGVGQAGGLVGIHAHDCEIRESFAEGGVTATSREADEVGGLVGRMGNHSRIFDSYAIGNVAADDDLGGLVGLSSHNNDQITRSYATGTVSGDDRIGGLVGSLSGDVQESYWNTDTSNTTNSAGGQGLDAAEFADPTSFSGWDFNTVWKMSAADGRPRLQWEQ